MDPGKKPRFSGLGAQLRVQRLGSGFDTHTYENVGVSHD